MIFDGKSFAKEIEDKVKAQVISMKVKPKIVSILVGADPASVLYTKLKSQAAQRVGIEFEVVKIGEQLTANSLRQKIAEIGARGDVTGVMVQLPLPELLRGRTSKLLEAIPLGKDVDGLRWEESGVKPATVRAILAIVDDVGSREQANEWLPKFLPRFDAWIISHLAG